MCKKKRGYRSTVVGTLYTTPHNPHNPHGVLTLFVSLICGEGREGGVFFYPVFFFFFENLSKCEYCDTRPHLLLHFSLSSLAKLVKWLLRWGKGGGWGVGKGVDIARFLSHKKKSIF